MSKYNQGVSVLLSILSAIGVVGTAVLAATETPKALKKIEESDAKTPTEKAKACWKCYIPAAAAGAATILAIGGSAILNKKTQASLAAAYAIAERGYKEYSGKVKEIFGQEAHETILKAVQAEKAQPEKISAVNWLDVTSLDFEGYDEEPVLFYDVYGDRYFTARPIDVLQAEYHTNRNFSLRGDACVNEFYNFLGVEPLLGHDQIGWEVVDELYFIDFNHVRNETDDGLVCYILEFSEPWEMGSV